MSLGAIVFLVLGCIIFFGGVVYGVIKMNK
ncbi:MAG: MetS family NSS transporter small subunit [Spirochaetes bacterium]|nr:MetS family NSS transporter small subunit [Spirochaetota bacterium]HRX17026.1 MetS family NSS transporter small subunit [Spirochaetota bacterium]